MARRVVKKKEPQTAPVETTVSTGARRVPPPPTPEQVAYENTLPQKAKKAIRKLDQKGTITTGGPVRAPVSPQQVISTLLSNQLEKRRNTAGRRPRARPRAAGSTLVSDNTTLG